MLPGTLASDQLRSVFLQKGFAHSDSHIIFRDLLAPRHWWIAFKLTSTMADGTIIEQIEPYYIGFVCEYSHFTDGSRRAWATVALVAAEKIYSLDAKTVGIAAEKYIIAPIGFDPRIYQGEDHD